MASTSDRTAPKRSQYDDLRLVAPRSAHRRQLLLLGQQRKTKHLTIEVNRSVEISHVHHDTLKIHPLLQAFSRRRHHAKPPYPSCTLHPELPAQICRFTSQPYVRDVRQRRTSLNLV